MAGTTVALEKEVEYKTPPRRGEGEFCFQPGSLPVLISALHGAAHTRHGQLKDSDDFTAGLARLCGELSGAHVLYAWRKSATDPNYYPDAPYKHALAQIVRRVDIRFVVDLHGCTSYCDFGIALGMMQGQSLPPENRRLILRLLYRHGFRREGGWLSRMDVERTFTAGNGNRQETITRFVSQRLGVPAVQIELNFYLWVVRRRLQASERHPFEGDAVMIERTISLLVGLVRAVARHATSDGFERGNPTKL